MFAGCSDNALEVRLSIVAFFFVPFIVDRVARCRCFVCLRVSPKGVVELPVIVLVQDSLGVPESVPSSGFQYNHTSRDVNL